MLSLYLWRSKNHPSTYTHSPAEVVAVKHFNSHQQGFNRRTSPASSIYLPECLAIKLGESCHAECIETSCMAGVFYYWYVPSSDGTHSHRNGIEIVTCGLHQCTSGNICHGVGMSRMYFSRFACCSQCCLSLLTVLPSGTRGTSHTDTHKLQNPCKGVWKRGRYAVAGGFQTIGQTAVFLLAGERMCELLEY